MKLNEFQALSISRVLLVPYYPHHVPTYHEWMTDDDLREATASDLLTLDEEHAMQQSWRRDHDKLTFILCLPTESASPQIQAGDDDRRKRMIGDINMFLYDSDSNGEGDGNPPALVGEISLMIARPEYRRQGYARAALLAFIEYVLNHWEALTSEYLNGKDDRDPPKSLPELSHLRVNISEHNEQSIKLFKSVGFTATQEKANYFGEVELLWQHDLGHLRQLPWYEKSRSLQYAVQP